MTDLNNNYNNNNNVSTYNKSFNNKNLTINTGINPETMINQSLQMDNNNNQQANSFIRMIFKIMPKNSQGKTFKNRIAVEMKLDQSTVQELGFEDKNDFESKLKTFRTKEPNYMSEEEFTAFLMCKGNQPPKEEEEKQNEIKEAQLYTLTGQNFNKYPGLGQLTEIEENLPCMSTTTFDFLKNPSTKTRLKHVKKLLGGKKSKSSSNFFNKSKNKYIVNKEDYIYYKDKSKTNSKNKNKTTYNNTLNHSYDYSRQIITNPNNKYNQYEKEFSPDNNYSVNNYGFNPYRYNKKSDINFTVPEPFNFLKNNYHEKKLTKIQEILEERKKNEDDIFNHNFHANPLNEKMFDKSGNLDNIINREKMKREERIKSKINDIKANMKPFSFYDKDFESFYARKNQECIPPKFIPFKANPIKWRSQVKMYDGIMDNENARKERNKRRAEELLSKAALPPRMEMHEKQKKLQEEEEKKMEKVKDKQDKEKRLFKAKNAPNFEKLHEKFINTLEKKKRAAHPTVPEPFTFHEPKKKADLCNFLDFENNPKSKNPKKNKSIEKIRKTMHKKPKIEPATTKSLTLLMETRRKELEMRKKKAEDIIREDEQRIKKQNDFNERVRKSAVMIENKKNWKELEDKRKRNMEQFHQDQIDYKKKKKKRFEEMKQRVSNRPLMMEEVVRKKDVNNMEQEKA